MKKTLSLLLSLFMLMSMALTSCAADEPINTTVTSNESNDTDTVIVLQIGNPIMTVNGAQKEIDPGNGTAPVIINERTLLPIRAVVEEMGGEVSWNEELREVTLTYGSDEIRLTIDSAAAYLNGNEQTLDAAPTIINERTMLPIRFVAESFHFSVEWNGDEQLVTISKSGSANQTIVNENLALISGGTFTMGSKTDEPEREADEVQHEVTVGSFYMSKTELTQGEYQSITGNNPSENKGDDLPVENITWYEAIQYCNELSIKEGLTPCYTVSGNTVTWDKSANGYRLPTEAEWEYAARANTDTPFSFGDYVHDEDANCYNAYGYNNGSSGSWVNGYLEHSVKTDSYNANSFGLYNVHGNVGEWVWDWYGEYNTEAQTDPTGAESGIYKVVRGGGWNDFPKHIRSAYRSSYPANVPLYSIGMRVVRNAEPSTGTVVSTDNAKQDEAAGKVLIAYFSQTGNTDGLAKIIEEMTGADLFRIERKTPYSSTNNSQGLYGEALTEQRENAVPELKAYLEDEGLDIDDYDTILIGYSNWWASIPAPVRSFLMHYDLSGKTIIPFCSMGGGRFGQTISAVAKLAPDSTIKEGLDVTYSSYDRTEIDAWLKASGIGEQGEEQPETETTKVLTVYFSNTGNTKALAEKVHSAAGGDIAEITPVTPYTSADLNYNNDNSRANSEINTDARPEIQPLSVDIEQYDVILVGYPIWWGQCPPAVRTFLDSYDLSGKTIMPFCTSGSSGIGGSLPKIRELCPDSTVTEGFRGTSGTTEAQIQTWLNGNGLTDD